MRAHRPAALSAVAVALLLAGPVGGAVCSFGIVPKPALDLWAVC